MNTATRNTHYAVGTWLLTVAFMIWVMVGIGGYTRDSGSGLSIMVWDPVIGTLPPLSAAAWDKMFALYQSIPQAQILHPGLDLTGFKTLFWPEYLHRLWGRLIGLVFFVPLVVFILTRRVEKRLIPWLGLLFLLGGLQGAIGWFMVASGFDPNSVAVQPWRLSLHFSAAMFLFVAVLWTGLNVLRPQPIAVPGALGLRRWALAAALLLVVTMFAGTFVSGTHAIDVFNAKTGAGMGAPPADYFTLQPWWLNLFANKAAVLFNHQMLASVTALVVLVAAVMALRSGVNGAVRDAALAVGALVLLQYALGVTALVSQMFDIGVAHQMNAVLLLAAFVYMLHALRGAAR
ncbi:MAG: COX15/CtaA family protein [Acidocella sp.]|nr:COX15/CtaA family protein [Acidocella sp.]